MATTYNSTQTTAGVQPVGNQAGFGVIVETTTVNTANTTGAINDVYNLFQVPAGATVLAIWISNPVLDSNGTPTATFNLGDSGSATRYLSASTAFRATQASQLGSATNGWQASSLPHTYAAADTIFLKFQAASATFPASGSILAYIMYTFNQAL